MLTKREIKQIRKTLEQAETLVERNMKRYNRGVKREVKRVYKLLKRENKHIKGYTPHAQDIYYYMLHHSSYPAHSVAHVEQYM